MLAVSSSSSKLLCVPIGHCQAEGGEKALLSCCGWPGDPEAGDTGGGPRGGQHGCSLSSMTSRPQECCGGQISFPTLSQEAVCKLVRGRQVSNQGLTQVHLTLELRPC